MQKYKTLDAFFNDLAEPRKTEVEAIRRIILASDSRLKEQLKWNAPSYALDGEDRITFNLHNPDHLRLVLHGGVNRKEDKKAPPIFQDETGLLEWNSDIRATITFLGLEHIESKRMELAKVITRWLAAFN